MYRTGFSYSSSIGKFITVFQAHTISEKYCSVDLFAGFFGQIAGYNTLNMQKTLSYVYELYSIPSQISGYPSLDERKQIIETNIKAAENLALIFKLNAPLQLKEFSAAQVFIKKF